MPPTSIASRVAGTVGLLMTVVALAAINRVSGPDYGFALFYLIPVVAAAVWLGHRSALLLAIAAATAWLGVDLSLHPPRHSNLAPSLWNGFTRLVIFAGAALLIARDREYQRQTLGLALTDPLTGLYNRRFLSAEGARLHAAADRRGQPYSVIALDVDGLKQVNDRDGHAGGDRILLATADQLRRSIRREDLAARLGGDEFAVLLPQTGSLEAALIAERIVQGPTRLSAGVASWHASRSFEDVLRDADARLYEAKSAGGHQIAPALARGETG